MKLFQGTENFDSKISFEYSQKIINKERQKVWIDKKFKKISAGKKHRLQNQFKKLSKSEFSTKFQVQSVFVKHLKFTKSKAFYRE